MKNFRQTATSLSKAKQDYYNGTANEDVIFFAKVKPIFGDLLGFFESSFSCRYYLSCDEVRSPHGFLNFS